MHVKTNILIALITFAVLNPTFARGAQNNGAGVANVVRDGVLAAACSVKTIAQYLFSAQEGLAVRGEGAKINISATVGVWGARAIITYYLASKVWNYVTAPVVVVVDEDLDEC